MISNPIPLRLLGLCVGSLLFFSNAFGQEGEEPGGYLFFGVTASAESGRAHFPIVGVDPKHIIVDNGMSIKKVSSRAPVRVRSELILSENYAEVLNLKFGTSSMKNIQRASRAVSDMHMADFQSELEVARIQGFGGEGAMSELSEADQDKIADIRQENEDFQNSMQDGLDHGAFELDEMADTIHVKGTLLPQTDIRGAYCVVVVKFNRENLETGESEGQGMFARARYIGDLYAGEITELQVRCSVGEFNKETAEYFLHIYSEEGQQVALSTSMGLKPLTSQEVSTFKELSAKTALNAGS